MYESMKSKIIRTDSNICIGDEGAFAIQCQDASIPKEIHHVTNVYFHMPKYKIAINEAIASGCRYYRRQQY